MKNKLTLMLAFSEHLFVILSFKVYIPISGKLHDLKMCKFYNPTTLVRRGTGYERWRTSNAITKLLQFLLEVALKLAVEQFHGNVSIGQFLQYFSNPIVVCAWSRPKTITKTYSRITVLE